MNARLSMVSPVDYIAKNVQLRPTKHVPDKLNWVAETPARTQEPGRSGSEGLGLTLVNLGAAWEGTRCHGRFLLTQQEGNPTPGRPARPQGLS
jgi:hypothetical protein